MLARNGNAQAAWEMFTKTGENSFEWMWKEANATSLWETLPVNEITQKSVGTASRNHPMQAGYDVTFFEDIAGIRPDSSGYGFKIIRFEPLFCDYLPWAKATISTPYGEAASSWKREGNSFDWEISIPSNSTGLLTMPFEGEFTINGKDWEEQKFPQVKTSTGVISYTFPSGRYHIKNK
jgi:alpha-L-rhamnosidase